MEASCVLWDFARKVSGTGMNSPLPGVEGTQGVMRPSHAEMAARYSSSSRQAAQAVVIMSRVTTQLHREV